MSEARSDARWTERLRLVPISAKHAPELWEIHQDEGVARWYPFSREQALRFAERMESSWRDHGVGKWLAYEESTDALVGRAVLGRRRGRGVRGDRLGVAPGSLGPRVRYRDRARRPRPSPVPPPDRGDAGAFRARLRAPQVDGLHADARRLPTRPDRRGGRVPPPGGSEARRVGGHQRHLRRGLPRPHRRRARGRGVSDNGPRTLSMAEVAELLSVATGAHDLFTRPECVEGSSANFAPRGFYEVRTRRR